MKTLSYFARMAVLPLFLLCCALNLPAQNYTWLKRADLPEPNYQSASFSLGNKAYVVGGVTSKNQSPLLLNGYVWEYDAATNAWTKKGSTPGTPVFAASSFVIDSYAYIVNGWDASNSAAGQIAGDTTLQATPGLLWRLFQAVHVIRARPLHLTARVM